MYVTVIAPPELGGEVVKFLKEQHGFVETDWTVMERPGVDFARADYAPCEPLTTSYYEPLTPGHYGDPAPTEAE